MTHKRTVAIVGVGPRGLRALENFVVTLHQQNALQHVQVLLFEETPNLGNGPVYSISQAKSNWINISERALNLAERLVIASEGLTIPNFPSYHEWSAKDFSIIPKEKKDTYPPRAQVGEYLSQRFQSIFQPLKEAGYVTLINEKVERLSIQGEKFILETANNSYDQLDEVLLTIGHQPTETSEQLLAWEEHVKNNSAIHLFSNPYPIEQFLTFNKLKHDNCIALRGFGLAMMDVVRGIAERFGAFISDETKNKVIQYQTEFNIKNLFVPFSLDGLPMSPKPLNPKIDQWFEPSDTLLLNFGEIIGDKKKQRKATGVSFLIDAISPVIIEVFLSLPAIVASPPLLENELKKIIQQWLTEDEFEHALVTPIAQSAEKSMRSFVDMAKGLKPISLDYCIGQVWRHCQPIIYDKLSYNECSNEVISDIVALDEGMKRYAYGPPVESVEQLLALVAADVMTLTFVKDPDFKLTNKGWTLICGEDSITTDIMINSVLDAPRLKSVSSSLVKNLLSDDLIQPVHDDLGILTDENGYAISQDDNRVLSLAVLGRLAKGTVIGVDAILECFGSRSKEWAEEAVSHHIKWLEKI